ncbi:hypothetical protein [Phenylobacterium sp.]|uniref:hypothetical protein n=1 Tax=Phenylobacterium sp. TaxID=1871053 RepID=UPI002734BEC4|nr:hypothetical protein [Phenylobacterium sp.]MDP3853178.1 hypothetical protein [Phenylobacterium sp.]
MRTAADLFVRTLRKLHRETRQGICAVLVAPNTGTPGVIGAYSVEGAGLEAMEFAAETFLDLVVQESAKEETTCPCCHDRADRARQALAILRQRPATRAMH